jgi:hypothetical protein
LARTTRTRSRRAPEWQIRKVASKEDRKRPSVFMRLKVDESFRGIALFEPDPELDDNPGYFEYYDHWDQQGQQYVPCAGDKCPFCAANDNPSTRALTVWLFPENDVKDQIKVFTMNYSTISDITDESEEEEGILGKKVRIRRLSDRGDYKVRVLGDKPLTQAQLKKSMAQVEDKFQNGLEGLVLSQLKAQMERLKALEAMEDDDEDEDEEETEERPVTRRGRPKAEVADEEEEDEEAEEEDEEEDEEEEDEEPEAEADEDEDEDEDEEEEAEEEEEEEEATEIKGGVFEVVSVNEREETFSLKGDDGKRQKMWLGDGVEVDWDSLKKGENVTVDALQDDEGDWVVVKIAVKKARASRSTGTRSTRTRRTTRK